MKRRLLSAPDIVILVYQAVVAALIVATWTRHDRPAAYLLINLGLMAGTVVLALLDSRHPSKLTTFLHAWWPVIVVPISFKQIAWIGPGVHPFEDGAWDRKLQNLDEFLFGDTRRFFRAIAWGPAADLLTIGYWSYFFLPIVLGASLYRPADLRKFREATTVMLVGWFVSYFGYFAVPALGPHRVLDGPRAAGLEGWLWAGPMHRALTAVEGRIPDAFPSGHALVAMLVVVLAWKLHRRLFWWLLPFATGLFLATLYLRYHYVVDVLVSVLLLPPCVGLGRALQKLREPEIVESPGQVWENRALSPTQEERP
jgi:hypothetical protein